MRGSAEAHASVVEVAHFPGGALRVILCAMDTTTEVDAPPATPQRRPRDPLMLWTVLVVVWMVSFFAALLVTGPDANPSEAEQALRWVVRIGLMVGVVGAVALGAGWARRLGYLGRTERKARPGEEGFVEDEAELRAVEGFEFKDLDVELNSPLERLAHTTRVINELGHTAKIDAVALVRELLNGGFSVGASDVHLMPESDGLRCTLRVDGVLHDVGVVPARQRQRVINRVKVMSQLSLHVHAKPQDGRFTFDSERYQARVSTLPTNHGEKVVIRLAVNDERRYELSHIGFDPELLAVYQTLLHREHGIIYFTGPTGSGKTTTMYASMTYIRDQLGDKLNLVTLEDPMEVDFRGMAQTQVNPHVGLDFASGLRSILRQDPDVIMLGEIRDEETAQIAIRAGLTGHLILTSVHADSTVGVFYRLSQLNLDKYQLTGASIAVVNQRLAVRNCSECTEEVEISDMHRRQLILLGVEEVKGPFFEGKGCDRCRGKGRRGRVPLLEVMRIDDELRELLVADTSKHDLERAAIEGGMVPLGVQAMQRANRGEIPVEEVVRVLSL